MYPDEIKKSINASIHINCKAPENPKINGGFSGLADATKNSHPSGGDIS
jgi:hypothetical protein